jgi:hypothetical protein
LGSRLAHTYLLLLAVCAAGLTVAKNARSYDQQVSSTLWAEGYSIPARDGSLVSRRRIVEDLHLAAWNLLADETDPYYRGPRLSIELGLRLDTDFAVTSEERDPDNQDAYVPGVNPLQLDVMFAYVDARGFWSGALDVRAGRQIRLDTLGYFAFDGAELVVYLPIGLSLSTFFGYEVRGGDLLGYDQLELDGVDSGGRDDELDADRYGDRVNPRARSAVGTEISLTPLSWIDAGVSFRTVGLSQPVADQRLGGRLALGARPVRAFGRVVWSPLLDRQDDLSAAFVEQTLVSEADAELEVTPHDAISVIAEYHLYRPTFEADSIFNVFNLLPQNDLGGRVVGRLGPVGASVWGFARLADQSAGLSGDEADSTVSGAGGGIGGNYRTDTDRISARLSGLTEWGETRIGAELGGGHGFLNGRLWLGLRGSYWRIDDDFSTKLSGDVVGYVASARFRIADGAEVLGEFENYYGGGREPRFVGLGILQLELWR